MYCVAVVIFILSLLLNCISISMRGAEHRFVINMMLLWKLNNYKNWLAWASDKLLFIFLILILVLDSSSWCTYGGFRTWGGEQGGLKSPRSRPKVLSPDNLAIFVAQLVGKTSFIPPHQPPHHPPYGTRETGPRANTSERNDEQ